MVMAQSQNVCECVVHVVIHNTACVSCLPPLIFLVVKLDLDSNVTRVLPFVMYKIEKLKMESPLEDEVTRRMPTTHDDQRKHLEEDVFPRLTNQSSYWLERIVVKGHNHVTFKFMYMMHVIVFIFDICCVCDARQFQLSQKRYAYQSLILTTTSIICCWVCQSKATHFILEECEWTIVMSRYQTWLKT